jgi:hypothetical protein
MIALLLKSCIQRTWRRQPSLAPDGLEMVMSRLCFLRALSLALALTTNALAASEEPGEGGISSAEACALYLKYFTQGDPGIKRPCDQESFEYIMDPSSECSAAVIRQAEAFIPRCQGAGGCAVLGERVREVCDDSGAARDCHCMPVTNVCRRIIVVSYSVVGGGTRPGTVQLGPRQTDKVTLCTKKRTENIQYNGWRFN